MAAEFVVKDMRVEGLQRISAGTVFNYLPVQVGDRINSERTAEAIRASGRQAGVAIGDLRRTDAVHAVCDAAVEQLGGDPQVHVDVERVVVCLEGPGQRPAGLGQ